MAESTPLTLRSPLPITPKKRNVLDDLLAQFGSQNSAEAATKTRRLSTRNVKQEEAKEEEATQDHNAPSSEDELTRSNRPGRIANFSLAPDMHTEDLKMEKRKQEKEGVLRRSTRDRKSIILDSDTVPLATAQSRRTPLQPIRKLDTARARLRDEIAHQSKVRANNFLVAHKDLFLPLLPSTNHVAKLAAQKNAGPIVEYEELEQQPEGVQAVMKPYQLSGLSFLVHLYNNGFSGILGDEMGLGKTLQTLSLFQYLEELDRRNGVTSEELRPYLVICPLSVLNSWVAEAERWVPELQVMRFHGVGNERDRLKKVAMGMEDMKGKETERAKSRKASHKAGRKVSKLASNDHSNTIKIVVTTYDTFQAEESWFKHAFVWRYVVLDEGHKIKASSTQISTALRNISAEHRLILTGTPLQNNLVEMWALLTWLYPDVFIKGTDKLFKESFNLNKGNVNRKTMDDARRLLELIMLRRMKDSPSVNLGLPPKEEILLYVPLTPMQKFWYTRILTRIDNGMLEDLFADGKKKEKLAMEQDLLELQAQDTGNSSNHKPGDWDEVANIMRNAIEKEKDRPESTKGAWQKLMNLVMQLRKCCSHPYLLPGTAPDPYYFGEHIIRASGKFILLEKLLKHTVLEQGKKVLIFSGFTRSLDFCEDLLSIVSNHGARFRSLRLDGSTARAKRNLDIRLFNQTGSDYKVMLLSTRAGGLGINLTSAQDVIFLDEDWNPQITLQAEARAHRIGQTKKVTIYKLCTQGTVEEQMMGRIRKKLYLSAKITESMQNVHGKSSKSAGRPSLTDDMPQMNTSQLKTLVRRGAQTLSHPEIDVTEMLSWDLDTMLAKCRDKPTDMTSEVDEDKWLSVMERVECAVFDGKRYQRERDDKGKTSAANILPDTITREDRRRGKNTTVMVDGFAINKESMNCADWEAVPTFAGKDPRLAEPVREKRRQYAHEQHCLACFEQSDREVIQCRGCPRSFHFDCLEPQDQAKIGGFRKFSCPQHNCSDCGKSTTDAGGLIFRCRWCPQGFCEDCLEWDRTELIGDNLLEFEVLAEGPMGNAFYIKCPTCMDTFANDKKHRAWVTEVEATYKEEHDIWLQQLEEMQRGAQQHTSISEPLPSTEQRSLVSTIESPSKRRTYVVVDSSDDDDTGVPSPPSLTDTSLSTPALPGSRVSTPKLFEPLPSAKQVKQTKKRMDYDREAVGPLPRAKKIKLSKRF